MMNNPQQKTICFLADGFIADSSATITGPMVQTYLIGKELSSRGWQVHYIAYNKQNHSHDEIYNNMHIHWIRYRKYIPVLLYFFPIYRRLRKLSPDVCYQRGRDVLTGFATLYCRRHSKKMIWASAGETGVQRDKFKSAIKKRNLSFLKKYLLFCEALINDRICEYGILASNVIIVQTQPQQNELLQNFNRKSVIIKSGHPVPNPAERVQPLKLLWIGSIKPVKRPELFIQIARLCSDLHCEFWLAGQMPDQIYGNTILKQMNNLMHIKYLGLIPFQESQTLIARAHILINTTETGYEGLPNAFVQAWLSGTITISLDTDPDGVITKNYLGARLHTIENVVSFIHDMVQNPEKLEKMSKNAITYATEHYSIRKIAGQLEEIFLLPL
jgi:glycosyltransferase involved in cell wall biosynthesis